MPQTITKGYKALVAEAESQIETLYQQQVALHAQVAALDRRSCTRGSSPAVLTRRSEPREENRGARTAVPEPR